MLLPPYYIASMNIEHAYLDRVGEYEPFEGICLADTVCHLFCQAAIKKMCSYVPRDSEQKDHSQQPLQMQRRIAISMGQERCLGGFLYSFTTKTAPNRKGARSVQRPYLMTRVAKASSETRSVTHKLEGWMTRRIEARMLSHRPISSPSP